MQGSGWAWLGYNKDLKTLQIATTSNQDPLQGTTVGDGAGQIAFQVTALPAGVRSCELVPAASSSYFWPA
jgi:superoxide dismutase